MGRRLFGLTALLALFGTLQVEPAEAGRRSRYCHQGTVSCATPQTLCGVQATCCAPQPAVCCAPSSGCVSSCVGPRIEPRVVKTYFCQSSPDPVYVLGNVPYYGGKEFTNLDAICATSGTQATNVIPHAICPRNSPTCNTPRLCGCQQTLCSTTRKRLEALPPGLKLTGGGQAKIVGTTWGRICYQQTPMRLELLIVEYYHPLTPNIPSYDAVGRETDFFPVPEADVPDYSFDEDGCALIVHAALDYKVHLFSAP